MKQARATRYVAHANSGASSMDVVMIDTEHGGFDMGYEVFERLFGLKIREGKDIAFEVKAVVISEKSCTVAR